MPVNKGFPFKWAQKRHKNKRETKKEGGIPSFSHPKIRFMSSAAFNLISSV